MQSEESVKLEKYNAEKRNEIQTEIDVELKMKQGLENMIALYNQ